MRYLSPRHGSHGLTLVELVVALAILSMLMLSSGTFFTEFLQNARLGEAGRSLYAELLLVQNEAIKRNGQVRVVVDGATVTTTEVATSTVLRSLELSGGVRASAVQIFGLGSDGRPAPFGTAVAVDLALSGTPCSADLRCPGLRVDAGGFIRLCANQLQCP